MNDLAKDKAIYNEMLRIANEVFDNAASKSEELREYLNEKRGNVPLGEILKRCSDVYNMIFCVTPYDVNTKEGYQTVSVDTFTCEFPPMRVFDLLKTWKQLAKVKGDVLFSYEEKIPNKRVGSLNLSFDNPTNAKTLARILSDDLIRPALCKVMVEVNATTGDINFVSSDGTILGVITNDKARMKTFPKENDNVYQALFSASEWNKICEYAKANSSVTLEVYKRDGEQLQDTMVADLGETRIKSEVVETPYPNWRKVLPKEEKFDKHFSIHPDDLKAARKFVKSFKVYNENAESMCVSFYRGSDIVYFDYFDIDFAIRKTATFRLESPSDITFGYRYNIARLKRVKFSGFHFESNTRASVVDCDDADLMMIMPMAPEEGEENVFDVERREVLVSEVVAA